MLSCRSYPKTFSVTFRSQVGIQKTSLCALRGHMPRSSQNTPHRPRSAAVHRGPSAVKRRPSILPPLTFERRAFQGALGANVAASAAPRRRHPGTTRTLGAYSLAWRDAKLVCLTLFELGCSSLGTSRQRHAETPMYSHVGNPWPSRDTAHPVSDEVANLTPYIACHSPICSNAAKRASTHLSPAVAASRINKDTGHFSPRGGKAVVRLRRD